MSVTLNTATSKKHNLWLEIDLGKLTANLNLLRSRVQTGAGVLAIVKANAYGHGLVACAKALESQEGIEYFGVTDLQEALHLRKNGVVKPILIFGFCDVSDASLLIQHDLTLTLSDLQQAEEFDAAISSLNGSSKLKIHLKVDTGMNRLGFSYRTAFQEILKLRTLSSLRLEGIFTHLAVADQKENSFTDEQLVRFETLLNQLSQEGLVFRYRHAANSGGLFNFKKSHFNLVRPGLSLYGLYENNESPVEFEASKLQPVLQWKSRVRLIKKIEPGDTVSYNRRFKASHPSRVAVLAVGYGHGYSYSLSSKSQVIIQGKLYPVVGQVCMDFCMVDIGLSDEIQEGDEAILIGSSGEVSVSANQLARLSGTIPYEIVTRINPTLPRIYSW